MDVLNHAFRANRDSISRQVTELPRFKLFKRYFTIKQSMNQAKFDALSHYRTSSLFTDAKYPLQISIDFCKTFDLFWEQRS